MTGALRALASRLLRAIDDALFPERVTCLCCDTALGETNDRLCPACAEALDALEARQLALTGADERPLAPGVSRLYAAYPYEGQARTLILNLKFRSQRPCAEPLIRAMAALPTLDEELLVPVPTTKRRLKRRGFNQAAVLAEGLSRAWGLPLCNALTRADERAAQVSLGADARRRNLTGCMRASDAVVGKRILLVDDVYTTGSTAGEAARALLCAGAKSVSVAVCARTVDPRRGKSVPPFPPKRGNSVLFLIK